MNFRPDHANANTVCVLIIVWERPIAERVNIARDMVAYVVSRHLGIDGDSIQDVGREVEGSLEAYPKGIS